VASIGANDSNLDSMLCVSQSAQRLYCSNVKSPPTREGSFWIWKK